MVGFFNGASACGLNLRQVGAADAVMSDWSFTPMGFYVGANILGFATFFEILTNTSSQIEVSSLNAQNEISVHSYVDYRGRN